MLQSNNIISKDYKLLESQVKILLKSLELYAFNFHNTWGTNLDDYENQRINELIFYTYESLMSQMNKNIYYRESYNLQYECRLKEQRRKRQIYYLKKNKKI